MLPAGPSLRSTNWNEFLTPAHRPAAPGQRAGVPGGPDDRGGEVNADEALPEVPQLTACPAWRVPRADACVMSGC